MVKPSDPLARPRADGHLERPGTWGEVTVGSLLAGPKRTDVLEVLETATGPNQLQHGHTLWFRILNRPTGEVWSVEPQPVKRPVVFLMADDAERPPPTTAAADAETMQLLLDKLGAHEIATLDLATGVVHAPNYATGALHAPRDGSNQELYHLKVMHAVDVSGIEAILDPHERLKAIINAHGKYHGPRAATMPQTGIPHRHAPENHSLI